MALLTEGSKAPAFKGINEKGEPIKLTDFKGQKLVLYFYPKDSTPGCTAEACDLRDNYNTLIKQGYAVVGVSPDSPKSHTKFIEKYELPFSLIADEDHSIAEAFGAWGEKSMYGKKYMGILRSTFIINEKGIIERVIEKVNTKAHAKQVLEN
jgi:peroxiredoxin Q/BCP